MLVIQKKCGAENCNNCEEKRCHNVPIVCRITNSNIPVCQGHADMLQEYFDTFMDLEIMWKKAHDISLEGVFSMAKDEALIEYVNKLPENTNEKQIMLNVLKIIDILSTQL